MAISFNFDHPHYLARDQVSFQCLAATGTINAFWVPQFDCDLTAIRVQCVIAGTNSGNTLAFAYGTATTAIGTYIGTTNAMFTGTTITPTTPIALTAGTPVWAVKGAEATAVQSVTYEYRVKPLSNVTA